MLIHFRCSSIKVSLIISFSTNLPRINSSTISTITKEETRIELESSSTKINLKLILHSKAEINKVLETNKCREIKEEKEAREKTEAEEGVKIID